MLPITSDDRQPMIGIYNFFHGDLTRAQQEIPVIAEAGINHIWLFIDEFFRKDKPRDEAKFEEFLQLLADHNLKFLPVLGQFISIELHPEVRIVIGDGTVSADPRYWNMGCFRHPKNYQWATCEIQNFLQKYQDHPLLYRIGGRIAMSFVHEAYYRTDTPEMGGDEMRPNCYCEYCCQSFRQRLESKYQTITAYNQTHKTAVSTWDEILPPLGPDPDPVLWLEWIDDHAQAIPDFLGRIIAFAHELAPIYSTHECNDFYPGSWQTTLTGNDIWRMAQTIDFGHEDMYPLEFDQQYQIYIFALLKDMMRSAMGFSRPYTGNGQAFTPWVIKAKLPENSLEEQTYTSLIHGVSGLIWWPGNDLDLIRKLKEPNQLLERWLAELPLATPEKQEVALLYSYTSMALAQNDQHPMDLQLIYTALCQSGIPVDILSEQQIAEGILQKRSYKLIILPGVSALPAATKNGLEEYAQNGGTLLIDYADARWEAFTTILNFHHSPENPRFYRTTGAFTTATRDLFVPVEAPRTGIPGFHGKEGTILAEFDTGVPALTLWRHGVGRIIGCGSSLGIDFSNYPGHIHLNKMFPFLIRMNRDARQLTSSLCALIGINPWAASSEPGVELGVYHKPDGSHLLFAVNHLPERVTTTITVPACAMRDTNVKGITITNGEKGMEIKLTLERLCGAWIRLSQHSTALFL